MCAVIWEWNNVLTDAQILVYSNNNTIINGGTNNQHIYNFTFDLTYLNGNNKNREVSYRLKQNRTYSFIIEFNETDL